MSDKPTITKVHQICTAQPGWRVLVKCGQGTDNPDNYELVRLNVVFWAIVDDTESWWQSAVGAAWGDGVEMLPYDWDVFGLYAPDEPITQIDRLSEDDRADEVAYCARHNLTLSPKESPCHPTHT